MNREQLINSLNKTFSKPSQLGLMSLKCIEELAVKNSIDVSNKSRNRLIDRIYNKTKNTEVLSDFVINIEVKKYKQEYFKEYTLYSPNDNITDVLTYLEFHRILILEFDLIEDMLKSNKSIKLQVSLERVYQRKLVNREIQEMTMYFTLSATDILKVNDFISTAYKVQYLEKI